MECKHGCRFASALLPLLLVAGLMLVSGAALGSPEGLILKVDKPVDTGALSGAGMMFLADIGDAYLIQGSMVASKRLAEVAPGYSTVAPVTPGKTTYLLRPAGLEAEIVYSAALLEVADGVFLAQLDAEELEDLSLLPFSRIRLFPGRFPRRMKPKPMHTLASITPKPQIDSLVARVSGDSLWKYIAQLSGEEGAVVGGVADTILTRFTFGSQIELAADYLFERFEDFGVDVAFQEYVQGKYDFYDLDFVDENYGWVVGYEQRIYKTTDGGATWARQKTGAFNNVYQDVCFIDTLQGWVAGVPGVVYHTTNGGASWTNQPTAGSMAWIYDVFFVDSLNGWIAGQDGGMEYTTDGGQTWTEDSTGTTENIYGLWFNSTSRGWACGRSGTILFWDGVSWSPQTSGATDFLRDLCFVSDSTGWAAGADRMVLKTTDGGQTWVPQPVPASPNPYLMDVCFIDSSEGWVNEYDGTMLHTTDGGASWEVQHAEGSPQLYGLDFVSATHGWSAGLSSAIQHTADGGSTWVNQTTNLSTGAWTLQRNVVATKPGTVSDEQVVICGHYDSISETPKIRAPGADDNGSGTAAVLEAARVIASTNFERTIKLVCFTGEEQGLCGSSEYAGRALASGDVIVGALNLDMIGYADALPEDIDVVSDSASEWLGDLTIDCAGAYVPSLLTRKLIDPGMQYSDHASFWRLGYNALDYEEDTPIVYPFYHTTRDTLGNLDQPFATDVVRLAVATLAELAVLDTSGSGVGLPEVAVTTSVSPNPFTAVTRFRFTLGSSGKVTVSVFDVEGRLVKTLADRPMDPGRHDVVWDGTDARGSRVAPGVYFTGVRTERASRYAKVVLLR
jgi:photosystem II stability/assembly factor-like uncharacterized protein